MSNERAKKKLCPLAFQKAITLLSRENIVGVNAYNAELKYIDAV